MNKLIDSIVNKDYTTAKNLVNEKLENIAERKKHEVKKMIAARKVVEQEADFITRQAFPSMGSGRRERLKREITESLNEGFDDYDVMAKHLVDRYGKKVRSDHVDSLEDDRDSKNPLDREKLWNHIKKHQENIKEETLDEAARIKIIRARIRGGKIQRRKKVSNVPGMTIRGGKLTRMSPAERRRRKIGQRRGKIKRRAKKSQMLRRRKMSLIKRNRLGI